MNTGSDLLNLCREDKAPPCVHGCARSDTPCLSTECRKWINFEEDLNCTLIAVIKNGDMTLREISSRVNLSVTQVKNIIDRAMGRLKHKLPKS